MNEHETVDVGHGIVLTKGLRRIIGRDLAHQYFHRQYIATCLCGWFGTTHDTGPDAQNEGDAHLAADA
jgi:hypothetical protein